MKESYQTKLWVNNKDIDLHPFVEQFVAGTVTGGVRTLKGVDDRAHSRTEDGEEGSHPCCQREVTGSHPVPQ